MEQLEFSHKTNPIKVIMQKYVVCIAIFFSLSQQFAKKVIYMEPSAANSMKSH